MTLQKPHFIQATLVFALLLAACTTRQIQANPKTQTTLPLQDCQLSAPGLAIKIPARCGQLAVYEDRAAGTGRQIEINLAIIPAVSRSPAPDPVFFLTGGPGQAATESYPQLSGAFTQLNQKRDIVLVDQRGTGHSHPLDCPAQERGGSDLPSNSDLAPQLEACLENLDANPILYTTSIAMEDLDQVRAALGYEQINLYGLSYGTRAALTYLRMFPARVRTVTLDGVVPQDSALGLNVAQDAQHALDLIFQRCESEADCQDTFPQLRQEFSKLLDRLQGDPVSVSLPEPTTGQITEVKFSAAEFGSAIRLLSYSQETVALLPLLIHTAYARQDFSPLAAQYLIVAGQLGESISEGMNYTVLCAEDVPFIDPQAAAKANQGAYLQDFQTDALQAICDTWPRAEIPADFKQPVQASTPVLLLSGEADPVTPPSNAEQAALTLPNSLSLVAAGQGHNVIYRGCLPDVMTAFIQSGALEGVDTTCVKEIQPMPFFINFSGPRP